MEVQQVPVPARPGKRPAAIDDAALQAAQWILYQDAGFDAPPEERLERPVRLVLMARALVLRRRKQRRWWVSEGQWNYENPRWCGLERATGFEPATLGLGSRCSTAELHPLATAYYTTASARSLPAPAGRPRTRVPSGRSSTAPSQKYRRNPGSVQ